MAELNFGLLTPPGSQSIGNAFAQGMDQAAVARAQENQNALAQYTLSKAKREDELNTQLLGDLRSATTNDEIYRAYQRAGKGDVASKLRGEQLTQDKTRLEIAGLPATQANTKAQTLTRYGTLMKNAATSVLANPTYENARQSVVNFGKATGQDVTQELQTIEDTGGDPVKIANWAKGHAVTGEQLLNQNKPPAVAQLIAYRDSLPLGRDRDAVTAMIEKASNENILISPFTGLPVDRRQGQQPPSGGAAPAPRAFVDPGIAQGVTPLLQAPNADEALRQALAMDAAGLPVNIRGRNALPGAQPPAAAPVNMMGAQPPAPAPAATTPLNPKEKLENFQTTLKLEEAGYRRTPQGNLEFIPGGKADPTVQATQTTEKLSARDLQKRETDYPQARQAVKTVNNTMTLIGATVDRLLANPDGLNGISGLIYGRTVALTAAARAASADLGQLKNLAFVQGLTELRATSKTGAGVGNVSNREGDRFENLKASLDTTQSTSDLTSALTRLKNQAAFTSQTLQETFDDTYAYKTQTQPTAPMDMQSAAQAEIARRAKAKR